MITSLYELVDHCRETGPTLAPGTGPDEYYLTNAWTSEPEPVSADLIGRLRELGVLHPYGGIIGFNATALRLLRDMREGGAPLEEAGFRARMEEAMRFCPGCRSEEWPEPEFHRPERRAPGPF